MKDAFVQKVKSVPSRPADFREASAKLPVKDTERATAPREGSRQVRRSAVTIGLAISMGATGMLLPNQEDKAMAAGSVISKSLLTSITSKTKAAKNSPQAQVKVKAGPHLAKSSASKATVKDAPRLSKSPTKKVTVKRAPIVARPTESKTVELPLPALEHKLKKGKTSPTLSKNQKRKSEAIAESNKIRLRKHLSVGQKLRVSERVNYLWQQQQNNALTSPVLMPMPKPETPAFGNSRQLKTGLTAPKLITETSRLEATKTLVNLSLPQPPPDTIYQVKPGDTLDRVARRYGVSRSQLVKVNKIDNPHLIKINQQLKIPQTNSAENASQIPTLISSVSNPPRSSIFKQSQFSGSPLIVANASVSSTLAIASASSETINTQVESQTNPYIEKLRADIERLRQESKNQRESTQEKATIAMQPVASQLSQPPSSPSTLFHPELLKDRLQREIRQEVRFNQPSTGTLDVYFQEQRQSQPSILPGSTTAAPTTPETEQEELVGAAPIEGENYNQLLRTPVGETVGPDLPQLLPPAQYLPDSPQQFNGYIWPSKGVLTSGYGWRWGRMHKGIDIAGPIGTPIMASASGEVVSAGWNSGGYGNLVKVKHSDGSLTLYAHNSRILVRKGQKVEQGQQIAEMGSTGYSTGPHLHFELHPIGRGAANPMAYLPKKRS